MDSIQSEVKRRGPFELSSDTRILYNVLEKTLIKDGKDLATYKELSASIGRDVQKEARGLLQTARRHVQNQHKVLLEAVANEGIKKTQEYEGALDRAIGHIRRTARRRTREVGQALNGKPINTALAAKLSIMGAMELFSRPKIPQRLLDTIEQGKLKELSTAETLKLFQASDQ